MKTTRLVGVALAVLGTACSGPRVGEDPAPRVARLVCEDGGARSLTPRVRAVSDGIHLLFDNESGAREFYIRTASSADHNHGGRLERVGTTDMRTTMPPGEILVGCFRRRADIEYSEVSPQYASVTVVDPEGLWIEPGLDCDEGEAKRYRDGPAEGAVPEDASEIVRSAVPGILATDQIIRPGYPETQWHGELRHVLRNGSAIAMATVYAQYGRWEVSVRPCPDVAIG